MNVDKQKRTTLPREGWPNCRILKELRRGHRTIKMAAESISKPSTRSKGKGVNILSPRKERQIKRLIQRLLTTAQIFE